MSINSRYSISNLGKSEHARLSGLVVLVVTELFPSLFLEVGLTALQVKLEHVKNGTLDVLGPGGFLLVEEDTFNESVNIVELDGLLELLEEFAVDFLLVEETSRLKLAGFLDGLVESTNTDVLELEGGDTFGFEVDVGDGGDSVGRDLLDVSESSRNLRLVTEAVLLSRAEGFSVFSPLLETARAGEGEGHKATQYDQSHFRTEDSVKN